MGDEATGSTTAQLSVSTGRAASNIGGNRRADIQGLRAVAVLLVLGYHAGLPMLGGFIGVDIFFVVSGFVITALLVRELERTGGIDFLRFYTRRVRRLLPALALVLAVTVVSAAVVLPLRGQVLTGRTGIAATAFLANFEIMRSTGGYFGSEAEKNALLHTWSLAVEEQFYLVFPALLALGWVVWGRRWRSRRAATTVVAVVLFVSFGLSLALSRGTTVPGLTDPGEFAFYSSPTRAWQFAAGSLLALHWPRLASSRVRFPSWSVSAGAWVGTAGIVWAAFQLRGNNYPGTAALIPTLATALLLATTDADSSPVGRLLRAKPATWIGDLSYSLYLWHWPILVLGNSLIPDPRVRTSILLVAAAILPAWLSYRWIENPIRLNNALVGRRVLVLVAACIIIPAALSSALLVASSNSWWKPDLIAWESSRNEQSLSRVAGCHTQSSEGAGSPLEECIFGEGEDGIVMVLGDSHAAAIGDSVLAALEGSGHRAAIRTAYGCPFLTDPDAWAIGADLERTESCIEGVSQEWDELDIVDPALVIIANRSAAYVRSSTVHRNDSEATEAWGREIERTVGAITGRGIPVLVVHEVPEHPSSLAGCARPWGIDPSCAFTEQSSLDPLQAAIAAVELAAVTAVPGATSWDPFPTLCDETRCYRVHNGVPIYLDGDHINPSASVLLAPALQEVLLPLIDGSSDVGKALEIP